MSSAEPMLNQGLPIRRVGTVTQATVTLLANKNPDAPARQRRNRELPLLTLPAQFELSGGWQLAHRCPTSEAEVKLNWDVPLFHDTRYLTSIYLHTSHLRNTGLLDSIAAVFDRLQPEGETQGERYAYKAVASGSVAGGSNPNLLYYKSRERAEEQFLLLYDERYAPSSYPQEDPSFVNIYELVQVELDEAVFTRLLQEALEAGYRARLAT